MRRWRRRSDWTPSRPLRGGLVVVGGISCLLILSTVYLFGLLHESRRAMHDSVREDAMWAVYQTSRQAASMRAVIDDVLISGDPAGLTAVVRAYDLLYSRATILQEGNFIIRFDATQDVADQAKETSNGILALAEMVDVLPAEPGSLPRVELLALRQRLEEVRATTDALVLATQAALGAARVAARAEGQRLQSALGVNVAALVVGFAGIIVLLVTQ